MRARRRPCCRAKRRRNLHALQRNEHTVEIDAPLPRVFELLSEPGEMKRWVGGLREFNSIDPGPAFGARATQVVELGGRRWEVESEITQFDPPRLLESTLRHRAFTSFVSYRLEENAGRTRVHGEIETDVRLGVNRLVGSIVRRQTQRKLEGDLERLKRLAEDES